MDVYLQRDRRKGIYAACVIEKENGSEKIWNMVENMEEGSMSPVARVSGAKGNASEHSPMCLRDAHHAAPRVDILVNENIRLYMSTFRFSLSPLPSSLDLSSPFRLFPSFALSQHSVVTPRMEPLYSSSGGNPSWTLLHDLILVYIYINTCSKYIPLCIYGSGYNTDI